MNETIDRVVNEAVTPTDVDYLRSRRAILDALGDGDVLDTFTLVAKLPLTEGFHPPGPKATVQFVEPLSDPGDVRDELRIKWVRLLIAGMWSLAELVARGAVIGCETPAGESIPNLSDALTIPWETSRSRASTRITCPVPSFTASHYRLAPALEQGRTWYTDPDLFVIDLEQLELDPRTRRCIAESLACWRRGLHLAATNMLGAAFEGAWMAAGNRLQALNPSIAKALDGKDPKIATVQKRVLGFLESRGRQSEATDLRSHANLLRDLRNYGIHTKPNPDGRLERYFEEDTAGLLLVTTHHHLMMLDQVVAGVLNEEENPAGP